MRTNDIPYVLKRQFDRTNLSSYMHCFWLFFIFWTTGKPIQVINISCIIYSSSIVLWNFSSLDIKYPSRSLLKTYFVYCWFVCIIFIASTFIDPETCPRVLLQIVSRSYPNWTYVFATPAGSWKVMARVLVFVIEPVVINTLIGFKEVPQVIQVWICICNFWPTGHKVPLG